MSVTIFISCATSEFGHYRDALERDLTRHDTNVKIQEAFKDYGDPSTVEKLDRYIAESDIVLHIVGDMTGAAAQPESTAAMMKRHPDIATTALSNAARRHRARRGNLLHAMGGVARALSRQTAGDRQTIRPAAGWACARCEIRIDAGDARKTGRAFAAAGGSGEVSGDRVSKRGRSRQAGWSWRSCG